MGVSINWLIGRSDEHLAPEFRTEDYALFCHSVVIRLLSELMPLAEDTPEAFNGDLYQINGISHADIAAAAMLDFMSVVNTQAGNASRPKRHFERNFKSICEAAFNSGIQSDFSKIFERKPYTKRLPK
ncbi:hypothetical protein ROLI_019230 [Roseobacter fucihabitans]|uniref:Uncharacterized protein n=1 Tax=Roseobacter fucihabitans TaxID=1537242 RepID=A0ABZ2BNJ6_9RHOB|nr:hypothetical protein [Roseobacter litoralis]MBC6966258.1 hypothetical protein [Roseobacter litoralis]